MEQQFTIDPKLLDELSKSIKTEKDLAALSKHLLKLTVERAMDAELGEHLGYEKHAVEGKNTGNSRNGYSFKSLKGNFGEVENHLAVSLLSILFLYSILLQQNILQRIPMGHSN